MIAKRSQASKTEVNAPIQKKSNVQFVNKLGSAKKKQWEKFRIRLEGTIWPHILSWGTIYLVILTILKQLTMGNGQWKRSWPEKLIEHLIEISYLFSLSPSPVHHASPVTEHGPLHSNSLGTSMAPTSGGTNNMHPVSWGEAQT